MSGHILQRKSQNITMSPPSGLKRLTQTGIRADCWSSNCQQLVVLYLSELLNVFFSSSNCSMYLSKWLTQTGVRVAEDITTTESQNVYVWVNTRSNMPMFCLKNLISQPQGVQNPPFWYRWCWPTTLWGQYCFGPNRPPIYVEKWQNVFFYHFLRVPKKTYAQSTGLPWKI